jgi:capsid protein
MLPSLLNASLGLQGRGLGQVTNKFQEIIANPNYSSSRLSLLNSRDRFKVLQVAMASKFNRLVYLTWLDMAVVGGVLNFTDYELRPERYQCVKWQFRGWTWVGSILIKKSKLL